MLLLLMVVVVLVALLFLSLLPFLSILAAQARAAQGHVSICYPACSEDAISFSACLTWEEVARHSKKLPHVVAISSCRSIRRKPFSGLHLKLQKDNQTLEIVCTGVNNNTAVLLLLDGINLSMTKTVLIIQQKIPP